MAPKKNYNWRSNFCFYFCRELQTRIPQRTTELAHC